MGKIGAVSGLLLDLDGVLVDSQVAVVRSWERWAAGHGLDPTPIRPLMSGRPSIEVIRAVAPHLDPEAESELVERLQVEDDEGVTAMPGARELLAAWEPASVAIATSCSPELAAARLSMAGLEPPAVLVTAGDVREGKPSPEPFLLAASRLGAEPASAPS